MSNNSSALDQSIFPFSCPLQLRFSDIDGYMHVNNGVYFSYFEHARALFLHETCGWNVMEVGTVVGKTTIEYLRPIHLEDTFKCLVRCTRIGNSSFDLEQVIVGEGYSEGKIFSKCHTVMVSVDMKTMKPKPVPEEYREKLLAKA